MRLQFRKRVFCTDDRWSDYGPWIDIGPGETFTITCDSRPGQYDFRVKKFVPGFYQSRDNAMTVRYCQTADDITAGEWMKVSLVREDDDEGSEK